jgi:ketosteroid isomerase-like protein
VKLVAALAVLLVSFAAPSWAATPADDTATLEALNAQWLNAYKTHDVAAVERVLADDFQAVYPGGRVLKKDDLLKVVGNTSRTIDSISWDSLKIMLFGDVAVVTGITKLSGTSAQGPFSSTNDYADVYVKRGGTWRVVSAHVVRASP